MVDPPSVLTTHLTELVRENVAELLSYAETQKLLDELPREQQKLVADMIPSQITRGRRAARAAVAAGGAGVDPRPADHPGRHPGGVRRRRRAPSRRSSRMCATRLARQISDSHTGPNGYIPLVTLSPEWEARLRRGAGRPAGGPAARDGADPKLQAFMQALRAAFDTAAATGETPVLLTSGGIRLHVRAIVERIRPNTPVLAQAEIFPRARIRTVGTI